MSIFKYLLIFVITFIFSSCSQEPKYKKIIGSTMGTTYSVIAKIDNQDINLIHKDIEQELHNINQLMSTYIADSEINRFNSLDDNSCFKFSGRTWQVLIASKMVFEQTDGAFDITLGPLISRWGFNVEEYQKKVPSSEEVTELLSQVGTDKLIFDSEKQCITKTIPTMTINLSAIAKGYGVDQIATILDGYDIKSYLLEIGGEVKAKGLKNFNQNWKVAVVKPTADFQQSQSVAVNLIDNSIATSGDYRNFFMHNGRRFSHTISPRTGYPVSHNLTSISVLHPSNMLADAYATALNVMGKEAAFSFAKEHKLPIYVITQQVDFAQSQSNKLFKAYISR